MERKALAIMAVYGPAGIVDDYIVYYLLSLKKVADRIIVVANGDLTGEGEDKLEGIADKIWIRENRGRMIPGIAINPGTSIENPQKELPCRRDCFYSAKLFPG